MFGFGGSHESGEQDLNRQENQNTTQNTTGNVKSTQNGLQTAFQDPLTTQFRSGLMGQYNDQLAKASSPDAVAGARAGFTGQVNQNTNNSLDSLKQNLASTGMLDSGAVATGASDIINNRSNLLGQYAANEPAMTAARVNQFLPGASALAAAGPTSVQTTGSQNTDSSQNTVGTLSDIISQILKSSSSKFGGSIGI